MRPDEVMRLKEPRALIIRTGRASILAQQFLWYKDKPMRALGSNPVDVPTQEIISCKFAHSAKQALINSNIKDEGFTRSVAKTKMN